MRQIKHYQQLAAFCGQPSFSAEEARAVGVHPSLINYYVASGLVERIGRGHYRLPDAPVETEFQWEDLVITAHSVPGSIVCMISALSIYKLTDEIPRQHWLAIPHNTSKPKRANTKFIRMRNTELGKTKILLGKETITIFDLERTIVDAFRYLSKEVAIKALKTAIEDPQQHKININKLNSYAKEFRIDLKPYLMVIFV